MQRALQMFCKWNFILQSRVKRQVGLLIKCRISANATILLGCRSPGLVSNASRLNSTNQRPLLNFDGCLRGHKQKSIWLGLHTSGGDLLTHQGVGQLQFQSGTGGQWLGLISCCCFCFFLTWSTSFLDPLLPIEWAKLPAIASTDEVVSVWVLCHPLLPNLLAVVRLPVSGDAAPRRTLLLTPFHIKWFSSRLTLGIDTSILVKFEPLNIGQREYKAMKHGI